jgi:hypothetical protein
MDGRLDESSTSSGMDMPLCFYASISNRNHCANVGITSKSEGYGVALRPFLRGCEERNAALASVRCCHNSSYLLCEETQVHTPTLFIIIYLLRRAGLNHDMQFRFNKSQHCFKNTACVRQFESFFKKTQGLIEFNLTLAYMGCTPQLYILL